MPEIAFSCFRFALLSSWPKFWMDQFFWENCAGTPVQNFPTILKTLKMMRMIIIWCCWICFLWISFEILRILLISNSVFFVWLCVLLCADVMHRNLASHFFYHPIFVLILLWALEDKYLLVTSDWTKNSWTCIQNTQTFRIWAEAR